MALVGLNGSELKVLLALPHENTKELDDVLEILHRCSCVDANVSTVNSNGPKTSPCVRDVWLLSLATL